jgi:hypothetical protein
MCQGHKNMNIMYKNQCSMTKIGFKLTISPFDYQIFTVPLTEPLRVDILVFPTGSVLLLFGYGKHGSTKGNRTTIAASDGSLAGC